MRKIVAACLLVLVLIAGSVFAVVQQGDPKIKVWVNTASNVYHCPGSQFYGKTQRGRYMLQITAQKKGIRPAEGQVCQ